MSGDIFPKFLASFPEYQATIEGLRPLKRPMLLWSTVSLAYVFSGLEITFETIFLWGFKVEGMTDNKLTIFLFSATLYYTVRWLWTRHQRLRAYKREGFMQVLWEYGMPLSAEKVGAGLVYHQLKHGGDGEEKITVSSEYWNAFSNVEQVTSHRGAIAELFDYKFPTKVMSWVEHIIIPHYGPP